jgi:hypothetical protein
MIHFNKITDYQSEILNNGETIGTLDLLGNEWYVVEIGYFSFPVEVKNKRLVKGLIERVYAKLRARDIRSLNKMRPHNEFKILE